MRFASHGPTDHPSAAGLIPVPALPAQGYQSRGIISGSPGIAKVPAPSPGGVPQSYNRALHRSSDAPDYWLPSLYSARGELEHAPVSVVSDNQMPVPAIDPRGKPAVMLRGPLFRGQRQVRSNKNNVSFPSMYGR